MHMLDLNIYNCFYFVFIKICTIYIYFNLIIINRVSIKPLINPKRFFKILNLVKQF